MCTLSVVATDNRGWVRVMMNRDERRLRPVAQPPRVVTTSVGAAIWPVDPVSGGTWIGVTAHGIALAVMNMDAHRSSEDMPSRGDIVPLFAACATTAELEEAWRAFDSRAFAPFRLVAATRRQLTVCEWGKGDPATQPLGRAHVFSSSSLGDALVAAPRRALFEQLLRAGPDAWTAQSRFHQHAWPDRRHLSVMMSRAGACTVSCTEVVLGPEDVSMRYRPVLEGWPAAPTSRSLTVVARAGCAA